MWLKTYQSPIVKTEDGVIKIVKCLFEIQLPSYFQYIMGLRVVVLYQTTILYSLFIKSIWI